MASPQRCRLRSVPCGSHSPPAQQLQVKVVGLFKSSTFQIAKSTAEVTAKKPQMPAALPASRLVPPGVRVRCSGKGCPGWAGPGQSGWNPEGRGKVRVRGGHSTSRRVPLKGDTSERSVQSLAVNKDIVAGRGNGGESIYGPTFEDENFAVPHNKRGVLGMVNKGRHTNGSQFYITLQATPYLDKKYVAFGQLIEGTEVLQQLELVPTENERPIPQCTIIGSGEYYA